MGVEVNKDLCTGCKNSSEPVCVKYCPGDLLMIDDEGKAAIRSMEDCWDCMVCVKLCPHKALETKLPYQLADYKARLVPEIYRSKIIWKTEDIEGQCEVFELQTKTEDSA